MAGDDAPKEHRTVSRITTILELVAAEPHGARLASLAAALDAPRSSIHGLVKGLLAVGYLREDDGGYVLGPAVSALLAPGRPALPALARPGMQRLQQQFDETVMLAVPVGDSVVYLDAVESSQLIRYSAPRRQRRPMYPTSTGKCLLAHATPQRRESYLRRHIANDRRRAQVRRELAAAREAAVAFNRGETLPDVSAVASIVLSAGKPVAALAIAGPTTRMEGKLDEAAAAVLAAARAIARELP